MTDADLANQARPSLSALGQYIKDLSFENPNAPNSLVPRENGPNIAINVNVTAKQIADTDFEVELLLEGKAGDGVDLIFLQKIFKA
jgi:preprotein translocase subunit SecB